VAIIELKSAAKHVFDTYLRFCIAREDEVLNNALAKLRHALWQKVA
jgi:hypothetical protein